MFEDLSGAKCLGDTFGAEVAQAKRPRYLKSGQPCTNYTRAGDELGQDGETGWMFVKQTEVIIKLQPWAFCLEISDNAININGGKEVKQVKAKLSAQYVVKCKLIQVWRHGDPSNRKRLFMVGLHRQLGQAAYEFNFPRGSYNEDRVPIALCIAVPDNQVPKGYWRNDAIPVREEAFNEGVSHRLQIIAKLGQGMGPKDLPYSILSWQGLLNGQTTLNGGGRRPSLSWEPGQPLNRTRMTVPAETVAAASAPDDYLGWSNQFAVGNSDEFLRLCINNGVPIHTGTDIDSQVLGILKRAKQRRAAPKDRWSSLARNTKWCSNIRSTLFDTGANGSINLPDVEAHLQDAVQSEFDITVANKERLAVGLDGTLQIQVINTAQHAGIPQSTGLEHRTTTAEVSMELFSFDPLFRQGWGCHLRPPDIEDGICELYKPKRENQQAVRVPLRYDWDGDGGFWLDYLIGNNLKSEHRALLANHHKDELQARTRAASIRLFDRSTTRAMVERAAKSKQVESMGHSKDIKEVNEVSYAQHPLDKMIKGVKAGLKRDRQKLSYKDAHELFGHLGSLPKCKICKLTKGCMRKILKKVDPHREYRAGFRWHMDTITWSVRSRHGCKYTTVLRDEASHYVVTLHHYLRSDIVDMFARWAEATRADPAYFDCPYKVISELCLDNAGEWAENCEAWTLVVDKLNFRCIYSCPDRKESAALAENTCQIVEIVTKSTLMQQNLPDFWWQEACDAGTFLLNRLPDSEQKANTPTDGDCVLPIELFTRFAYSRRQVMRELSYFLLPGTPALCHCTDVKGSAVEPKARWGIAKAMQREQVVFECPYTQSEFKTKSYCSFDLKDGINFAQFLKLPKLETTRKGAAIPADYKETVVVELPSADWLAKAPDAPTVNEVKAVGDMADRPPTVKIYPSNDSGGSVQVVDAAGEQVDVGPVFVNPCTPPTPFAAGAAEAGFYENRNQAGKRRKKAKFNLSNCDGGHIGAKHLEPSCIEPGCCEFVDVIPSKQEQAMFDKYDEAAAASKAFTTNGLQGFTRVCKELGLEFENHQAYHKWLIEHRGFTEEIISSEGRAKLRAGLTLPYPTGKAWRDIRAVGSRKKRRASFLDADPNVDATEASEKWLLAELEQQKLAARGSGKYCFNIRKGAEAIKFNIGTKQVSRATAAKRCKKKRIKAAEAGKEQAPGSVRQALEGQDWENWCKSMVKEWQPLVDNGVIDLGPSGKGYKASELPAQGCKGKPVPLGTYFKKVWGADGELVKDKTRICLQGHPGNMTKGVHYTATFGATPKENTATVLCALVCLLNLTRGAFDIAKAYCTADLPPGELIALRLPDGFQQTDTETGEPLFGILRKNLYGHPSAMRTYGIDRNAKLMKAFNRDGWSCKRSRADPCLFSITRDYDREQRPCKRLRTWSRVDKEATHFQTTPQGNQAAPRWDQVIKRTTRNLDSGELIEELDLSEPTQLASNDKSLHTELPSGKQNTVTSFQYMADKYAKTKRLWMSCHVDDFDIVSEGEQIKREAIQVCKGIWDLSEIDPEYILGVRRKLFRDGLGKVASLELDMSAYVEGMAEAFASRLPIKANDPFPPGLQLSKSDQVSEEESKAVRKAGYQCAVGMLMWAARHVHKECKLGVSMLCRVMATPSWRAFEAAMQMIRWMHQRRATGTKFTAGSNFRPIGLVDASNKQDPADSKVQYGAVFFMANGPVMSISRKLKIIAHSTEHGEYMALSYAHQMLIWLRQLLQEMGLSEMIAEPTVMLCDNKPAVILSQEDIVTQGNQYIRLAFHNNKEMQELGDSVVEYVRTGRNISDILTKAVDHQTMKQLLEAMTGFDTRLLQSLIAELKEKGLYLG